MFHSRLLLPIVIILGCMSKQTQKNLCWLHFVSVKSLALIESWPIWTVAFINSYFCLLRDAPISIKMRFDKNRLNLNMGRLLAHEIGHALGANHDDGAYALISFLYNNPQQPRHSNKFVADFPPCQGRDYLMNSVVSNSMNTWSKCSARDIDKIVSQRTKASMCFHV